MSEAGEKAEVSPESSASGTKDDVADATEQDDIGPTGNDSTEQSTEQAKEFEDITDADENTGEREDTKQEEIENEEEKNNEETYQLGDEGDVVEEDSENVKDSPAIDDMTGVEDSPSIDDTAVVESTTVEDLPAKEDMKTSEDHPIVEDSPPAVNPTDEEGLSAVDSPTGTDNVEMAENNDKDQTTEDMDETENVCDSLEEELVLKLEDTEVNDDVGAETEETSNNNVQSPKNEDELLQDDKDLKDDVEEDGKQQEQDIVDEDKLLEDDVNKESIEMVDKSASNDNTEGKPDKSKEEDEQESSGDMMLQIGSVTGNAEMLDDADMLDDDQNTSQKETEEETGEESKMVTDADEEKKEEDVEMTDAEKEVKKDEESDVQNAEVKGTNNDVEMIVDENKEVKSDVKSEEVKTELVDKPEASKPAEEVKAELEDKPKASKPAEEDDDDVKIIDIRSDDEDDKGKDKKVTLEDEKKDDKTGGENGEMCLQIASVSGGVDMPEQNFEDKKEVKKEQDMKVKEESASTDIKQEPKSGEAKPKSTSKTQTCIVCQKIGKCKYNIVRNGDIKHLCDDVCFKQFRANPTMFLRASTDTPTTKKPESPAQAPPPPVPPPSQERYKTCSICQLMNVKTSKPFLNWQCMDFCGEDCLGKFQAGLNASCNYCGQTVQQASKGKFCARVDNDVKQFCSGPCYNEFKKRQKLCEYCQKDVTKISDAFVAPVGKDALFKDFCSQGCLQKYEEKSNRDVEIVGVDRPQKSQVPPKGNFQCAVCRKTGPVKHEIKLEGRMNRLCSDPCFSAFQYANKLTMNTCDNCGIYCYNEGMAPQYIQFEGQQKRFCSFMCVNTFKTLNKKVVSCAWCNSKKSNFDMIERVDANNKYQLFCSLNCLSLYRVNLQATSNQAVVCDQCRKFVPAQYHLTMSDASVRNFCSYQCVMTFQSQFAGGSNKSQTPIMNTAPQNQKTTTARTNNRNTPTRTSSRVVASQQKQTHVPVISNVVSLSSQNTDASKPQAKKNNAPLLRGPQQGMRNTQMPALVNSQTAQPRASVATTAMQTPPQQIIIQPPPPKTVKNKSLLCKPFVQTKATSCRPHTQTKETQTDEDFTPKQCLVPVPIPYYIPVPMMMYTQYTPVPLPIPVPIPVPCFIPTTKKSANSIFKHIKEIQERIPSDPLEAELLMMAEAVAVVDPDSDSESENEDILPRSKTPPADGGTISNTPSPMPDPVPEVAPAPGQPNGEFGEDMLQMALRMATEMTSEPVMDLENSIAPVPVNTEPPPPPHEEDEDEYVPTRETRSRGRGPKRSGSRGNRKSKRQKVIHPLEQEEKMETEPVMEPEVPEIPPDANMYLKYTYGVNAWKHWVVLKNAQLEKVSKHGSGKLKLFKTDMMGCSADELNYSLCLFVKEVRKPNGDEYAPDSIYYLCLGIQQYLFENSRIDNIFTDMYYEKFTECLNEVLNRYEPKINTAGQLVCRIEEEHLWECKQLGAHSPHVLLNTLVFFNTKYFMLKEVDDHMKLSFTHIMKHWKKTPIGKNNTTGRSVYLRYYCPNPTKVTNDMNQKKKQKDEVPVYEQAENLDNPLRCPVKLYEFYLSKCPESIKNRNDAFYLTPERSCVPDSPVWYSTQNLSSEAMNKMLNRARLVREIQEAMLLTQPVFM